MNDEEIKVRFVTYIEKMNDAPRHTPEAIMETKEFADFCEKEYAGDLRKQDQVYDKAVSMALSFEESGFLAGYKMALSDFNYGGKK